jgi:uncharacterized protein
VAEKVLVDTGPIVASLVRADAYNGWARDQFARLAPPLLTCEPVLAEVSYIVGSRGGDPVTVLKMLQTGVITVAFDLQHEVAAVEVLMRRYRSVPMALADACLVRMSEVHGRCSVLTTDTDFRIYRRHGRLVIPAVLPPGM